MSRLYHTEEGRVIPSLCEELTRFRWARKTLDLPATSAPAVSRLRTFAARMLAATEHALFVSRNKGTTKRIGSYEDINKDAATQAQGAFRARVLAACLDGENPTPNADGCCVS